MAFPIFHFSHHHLWSRFTARGLRRRWDLVELPIFLSTIYLSGFTLIIFFFSLVCITSSGISLTKKSTNKKRRARRLAGWIDMHAGRRAEEKSRKKSLMTQYKIRHPSRCFLGKDMQLSFFRFFSSLLIYQKLLYIHRLPSLTSLLMFNILIPPPFHQWTGQPPILCLSIYLLTLPLGIDCFIMHPLLCFSQHVASRWPAQHISIAYSR